MKRQKKEAACLIFSCVHIIGLYRVLSNFTPYEPTQSFISPIISKAEELYLSFMNIYFIGYE